MKKSVPIKRSVGEVLCGAYLCLLGVALPLAVHELYYDITRTKATVFWVLSGALVLGALLWLILDGVARRGLARPNTAEILFTVFAVMPILSSVLFRPFGASLLGADNRFQGVVSFALYALSFALLRRYGRWDGLVCYALLLGSVTACALATAEVFGLDLLGLRGASPAIELPRFFSTVGNISFLSALCVLLLPLCACLALEADSMSRAVPFALGALVFLCCGIAMRTETFVLGAVAFFALLPLFVRETRVLRRLPLFYALSALTALFFALAMRRWALYRLSELGAVLCSPRLLPAAALLFGLWLVLRKRGDLAVVKLRKVYIILFLLLFAAGCAFLTLANTLWADRLGGTLGKVAVFSPAWGSDRGTVWMSFWGMFREASPLQKLIGCGVGSLAEWDRAHRLFGDAVTDSAHNEYLHYLLTGGLIGLGCYVGVLFLAIRSAWRRPSRERIAVSLAVSCYAVQALVNIAQPFTTPLFFALLALLCSPDAFAPGADREKSFFVPVALAVLAAGLLVAAAATAR